ncbi:MAG: hypothetical protein ACKVZJ_03835 [Phycisphaerales bacterium]
MASIAVVCVTATASAQIARRPFHPVHGTTRSHAVCGGADMSLDGTVVSTEQTFFDPVEQFAVRWTFEQGTRRLALGPGHLQSQARAISEDARVVVGNALRADGTWVPVRWVGDAPSEELPGTEYPGGTSECVLVSETGRLIAGYAIPNVWAAAPRWFVWEEGQETRWIFGKHPDDPRCTLIAVRERSDFNRGQVEGIMDESGLGTGFILSLSRGRLNTARSPEPLPNGGSRRFVPTCSSYLVMAGVVYENYIPAGTWVWDMRGGACEPFRIMPAQQDGTVFWPKSLRQSNDYMLGTLYGPGGSIAAGAAFGGPAVPLVERFVADGIVGANAAWLNTLEAAGLSRIVGTGAAPCSPGSFLWVYVPEDREPFCPDIWGDDGIVNHRDLESLIFQMQGAWFDSCSDLDHDGRITTSDLRLLVRHVGTTCPR